MSGLGGDPPNASGHVSTTDCRALLTLGKGGDSRYRRRKQPALAQALWLTRGVPCRYAEAILAYVALQVSAKRFKEARSIFRKYHRRQLHERGGPAVCEAWLRFEREYGSAEDHFQALVKAEPVLSHDAATAAGAADPQLAADAQVGPSKPQHSHLCWQTRTSVAEFPG